MKKSTAILALIVVTVLTSITQAAPRSQYMSNPTEKDLLILGSGGFSEAYQPLLAYDIQLSCIMPYMKGDWQYRSWGIRFGADIIGEGIKKRKAAEAAALFESEKAKRPDICIVDYKNDIATDLDLLQTLNELAQSTYDRMGHMTGGAPEDQLKLKATDPLAICLNDLKMVEYMNVIAAKCK